MDNVYGNRCEVFFRVKTTENIDSRENKKNLARCFHGEFRRGILIAIAIGERSYICNENGKHLIFT